jgi:hypothetical protein
VADQLDAGKPSRAHPLEWLLVVAQPATNEHIRFDGNGRKKPIIARFLRGWWLRSA